MTEETCQSKSKRRQREHQIGFRALEITGSLTRGDFDSDLGIKLTLLRSMSIASWAIRRRRKLVEKMKKSGVGSRWMKIGFHG